MLNAYFALINSFFTMIGAFLNVPWFKLTTSENSVPMYLGTYVLFTSMITLFVLFMLRLLGKKKRGN